MSSDAPPSTPRPSLSLNRQEVLDEDEYTAALSRIIARDFFPSLVHLESTNEYLDAVQAQDSARIALSVRRLHDLQQTPLLTPGRTPYLTPRGDREGPPNKKQRLNTDLGLDAFQARYTSEDNSSFTQILDEDNRQRREKYRWAWAAENRANELRHKQIAASDRLLIEAPKPLAITANGEKDEAARDTETELTVAVVPKSDADDGQPVDVMAKKKDTRTALVDGWAFKNRNALMFPPDADVSPFNLTIPDSAQEAKEIKHSNTRLPEQDETSEAVEEPPSPTQSRVAAAIAGTPYHPSPDGPQIRGFSYVPAVPSINAAELAPAQVKQLMTWGTLDATPRVLSRNGDDAAPVEPNTPFHLRAPSHREQIASKLSSTAAKSLREKAAIMNGTPRLGAAGRASMPPPRTPREGAGLLTPAAKRLLERTAGARRAEAMSRSAGWESGKKERDMARVRWTPSPSPRRREI